MRGGEAVSDERVAVRVVYNRLGEVARALPGAVDEVVMATAAEVEGLVKLSMQAPKSGRLYGRGGGKVHQASAAGEAPAIDTSALVNSVGHRRRGRASAIVFAGTEYAAALEFGGRRVAARPFMRPAAAAGLRGFVAAMQDLERRL